MFKDDSTLPEALSAFWQTRNISCGTI
jgi:hypothetical protein